MQRPLLRQLFGGLAAVAAIGLAVLAYVQHSTIAQLREEEREWQANSSELERLRLAVKDPQNSSDTQSEIEQLRADGKEVLRLRSEMTKLREEAAKAATLEQANARLLELVQGQGGVSMDSNQAAAVNSVRRRGAILGIAFVPPGTGAAPRYQGVVVGSFLANAPAAHSGVRPGDIIYRLDGQTIATPTDLESQMMGKRVGETVTVDVMRGDVSMQFPVQTCDWPN
jgi:C-terminal processing protease CtpA/Prc